MDTINITSVEYVRFDDQEVNTVKAVVDGKISFVPMTLGNTLYAEIMRQVEAGTLTIAEAE